MPKLVFFHALRAALRLGRGGGHGSDVNLTIVTTLRAPWAKQAFEIAGAPYLELTDEQEFASVYLGQHLGASPRTLHPSGGCHVITLGPASLQSHQVIRSTLAHTAVAFLDFYKSSARRLAVACERDTCPTSGELAATRLGTRGALLPRPFQSSITVRRREHGVVVTATAEERIAVYFSRQDATDDGGHGAKVHRRTLADEPELIDRLADIDITTRTFSELSLVERVSYLRGVRMAVMLYGAGVANLLYTGRSTALVVICDVWAATEPSNRRYFEQLAAALGVSLEFVDAGQGARPADPSASGGHARRARLMQPFVIDLNATVEALATRRGELIN